jgi:long-chain fatty acid transport protein
MNGLSIRHQSWLEGCRSSLLSVCAIAGVLSAPAQANMGSVAMNYGLLPTDVATAQALSLFNPQISALFYNPAYLAEDGRGELTVGLIHSAPDLQVESLGGSNPPARSGETLVDTPSQQVLLGMKTDLTDISEYERPLYFGIMLGVEKYGKEMMAFNSSTSNEGQPLRYERQPLFLNIGGMMVLTHGIDIGVSTLVTLHADADLVARTDLAGNTKYEQINVSAKPSITPIVGMTLDWTKLFCGAGDCFANGWQTALSYRESTYAGTSVSANTVIPGTIPAPGLTLSIATIDAYQPRVVSIGTQFRGKRFRVGITVEEQKWSALGAELRNDTVKDQAMLEFENIVVPRLGAEFTVNKHLILSAGVAKEDSPLVGRTSQDVNYFDNDKTVVGLGAALEFSDFPVLAYPLRLDFGYQYQQLKDREFDLTSENAPSNPYETIRAGGEAHIFSGSMTLKF